MDTKELKKLAKICRQLGISYYKDGDVEINFGSPPAQPVKSRIKKIQEDLRPDKFDSEEPTDEELLFFSSPNIPVPN